MSNPELYKMPPLVFLLFASTSLYSFNEKTLNEAINSYHTTLTDHYERNLRNRLYESFRPGQECQPYAPG